MKIVCIHCGGEFSIRGEDLGGSGFCPHCKGAVTLPKPEAAKGVKALERPAPSNWLEGSMSGLLSFALHMSLFIIIALWQFDGGQGGAGEGEEIQIGVLPHSELSESPEEQLATAEVQKQQTTDQVELADVEAPATATSASAAEGDLALATPSPSGGQSGAFDLGSVQAGGGSMGGGTWEGMIGTLRKNGLDIVICFDSTGSMSGEIDQVKRQIERIGTALMTLVPKSRISICTYRDTGDEYLVKGLPLTSSIQDVSTYLGKISAGGGGDHPEAVEEGLYWSINQNSFRPAARKVILVFGDAPPHPHSMKKCLDLAGGFRGQNKGIVSTVTCRDSEPMPEFYEIAAAGGGEAFLAADQRQIVTQLMVLVFGSRHRQKVVEAFKLLES